MKRRVRVCALLVVLLSLAGCGPANRLDRLEEAKVAKLTERARQHLRTELGVGDEAIRVKGVRPLAPLCYDQDTCTREPGYVIQLVVDGRTHEYSARMLGDACVLWREV